MPKPAAATIDQPLTAQQRIARAGETARTAAAARTEREVARAERAEQRRIDREAAAEREAETMAHYRSELPAEHGIDHLPREIADKVFTMAYSAGHSSGWGDVSHHYEQFAEVALAAYEAGVTAGSKAGQQ